MKTTICTSLILIAACLSSLTIKAQKTKPVFTNYFELTASALLDDKRTNNYEISVYLDGELKESIVMKRNTPINIVLESGKVYSIVFNKANYPPRIVIVNTEVPNDLREVDEYPMDIQVELSPSTSTHKKELLDYPVAVLMLDKKEKNLVASERYFLATHDEK